MGGEVVYRKSWFGAVKIFVLYLVAIGSIFVLRPYSGVSEWLLLGAFALSALVMTIFQVMNGAHSVALTGRGLEFRRWRKRLFIPWEEIADVRVVTGTGRNGTSRPVRFAGLVVRDGTTRRVPLVSTLAEPCPWPIMFLDPRIQYRVDPHFDEKVAELRSRTSQEPPAA